MTRRWLTPVTALVAGCMALTTAVPAWGAPAARANGERSHWEVYWSGYALTGGTFTTVTASWTQSAINCADAKQPADASSWAGLDGFGAKLRPPRWLTATTSPSHG
jgi:hypothetical protein